MNFWEKLPKPIVVLAPMANVTDAPFRRVILEHSKHVRKDGTIGGPDVFWTEFVSADGLMRATPEGKEKLMADLMYTEAERPIVAQLFSSHPEYMEKAARLCRELGFDGIDINMGCPDRTIEKQGCGAAMIRHPERAVEVLRAAKRGAEHVPVSVKTRIGYNKNELDTWLPILLAEHPAAITVHARTRKEMSKVPARWEHLREAVAIRDAIQNEEWQQKHPNAEKTLILGNGDVHSLADAYAKIEESGADGAMLGRAIFGNPWLFNSEGGIDMVSIPERLRVLCEHTRLFEALLPFKSFGIMKKHYKAYVNNFDGAKELRTELMETENGDEVEKVVNRWIEKCTE
jgi:nifR3 family TIM-barrel protein